MSWKPHPTILIALAAAIIGAAIVYVTSASWEATAASALAAGIIVALLFDATERTSTAPTYLAEHAPIAAPVGENELQSLIQAMPNPMLIVSHGRIVQCNSAATALLGAHILGEDVRLGIRHPAAVDILSGARPSSDTVSLDIVGLGDARQSWELRIVPLSAARQLASFIDHSGRQATERMRVDFVANASHELRTPLAGILGFIETLRDADAGADPATRDRFLSIMDGEARRMQRLVDDLMSLSRIEADKFRAPDQPVDLSLLANEVADVFRQDPSVKGRAIDIDMIDSVNPVRGDRAQLSQLLHNLVSNAVKYGGAGTTVTIGLKTTRGGMVELAVTDRGDGIAKEHLPRLTERFYRVDSSRSRAMGGTGLGLAIVKHIVQRHRGHLHLESRLTQGTTVRVELPPMES